MSTFSQIQDSEQVLNQLTSEMKYQQDMVKQVCNQLVESLTYFS